MFLRRMIQKLSEDGVARCKMTVQLCVIDTKLSPRGCAEGVAARVHVLPDVEAGRDNDECWKIADELCKQQQHAASVLCCGELQVSLLQALHPPWVEIVELLRARDERDRKLGAILRLNTRSSFPVSTDLVSARVF